MFQRTVSFLLLAWPVVRAKLVITELMINPLNAADASTQWFEVFNTDTSNAVPLNDWGIQICSATLGNFCEGYSLVTTKSIDPLGYIVIGTNDNRAANGGVTVDFVLGFAGFARFPKSGGGRNALSLYAPTGFLEDELRWNTVSPTSTHLAYPFVAGASLAKQNATAMGDEGRAVANWQASTAIINCVLKGDKGTPGKINAPCPVPTKAPVKVPTKAPTKAPTKSPSKAPVKVPTKAPTNAPVNATTKAPTKAPVKAPTNAIIKAPAVAPVSAPTKDFTIAPVNAPTSAPVTAPTSAPVNAPTSAPVTAPVDAPTSRPVSTVTNAPVRVPTNAPAAASTTAPVYAPTLSPINNLITPTAPNTPAQAPTPVQATKGPTSTDVNTRRPVASSRPPTRSPVTDPSTPLVPILGQFLTKTPVTTPRPVATPLERPTAMAPVSVKLPSASVVPVKAPTQSDALAPARPMVAPSMVSPIVTPTRGPMMATPTLRPNVPSPTAPVVAPVVPARKRCGVWRLGILCFNGCGIIGRILKLCKQ